MCTVFGGARGHYVVLPFHSRGCCEWRCYGSVCHINLMISFKVVLLQIWMVTAQETEKKFFKRMAGS